jgi:hypothetical protein
MAVIDVPIDEPHAGQWRVINEAARFNVLECGRRFGKTKLGIFLCCLAAGQGQPVGWFAPTYKLLSEVWREAERTLKPLSPRVNVQERRIELPRKGSWEFWSLDQPDAGRGRKYGRVVIDEGGIVRNLESAWNEAIRPTLTDLKGDAWFLGTPKGRNFFHRLFARGESGEPGWKSWRLPTVDNPFIDADEIEAARRDLPEAAFRQEFLGIPADDGGNPFGLAAIKACEAPLSRGPALCYGVDLAKSQDWTAVCGVDADGAVCLLERWQSDWGQTRRRVLDLIGDAPALIDSTGVGDPIVEDLQRERLSVEGFKFTGPSKQQIMEGLAAVIQRREVRFPAGWLVNELEAFEYEYTRSGVRYSAPDGLHDDGVCALALCNEMRGRLVHEVAKFDSDGYVIVGRN